MVLPKAHSDSQPSQVFDSTQMEDGEHTHPLGRALRVYVHRTKAHRETDQLFDCFKPMIYIF